MELDLTWQEHWLLSDCSWYQQHLLLSDAAHWPRWAVPLVVQGRECLPITGNAWSTIQRPSHPVSYNDSPLEASPVGCQFYIVGTRYCLVRSSRRQVPASPFKEKEQEEDQCKRTDNGACCDDSQPYIVPTVR